MANLALLIVSLFVSLALLLNNHAVHLSIQRRGSRFILHESANLTRLAQMLHNVEDRYSRTYRSPDLNRLVRKWTPTHDLPSMLNDAGSDGTWYTTLHVGEPSQSLQFDLDLLSPDFYTILTSSTGGSKFNTFASETFASGDSFVHPLCRLPSDVFHLPNQRSTVQLQWPICQPSKSSRHTLFNSGSILGLGPNLRDRKSSLSRLTVSTFVQQLQDRDIIRSPIWSITLLDSVTGVLSLGGTLATEFEEAKVRTEVELRYLGQDDAQPRIEEEVKAKMAFAIPEHSTIEDHFKWTGVSGASGWWTGLMNGVWVDGVKILKNQPFLIDLSCPFIIAPPTSFKHLYNSISGSKPLCPHSHSDSGAEQLKDELKDTFHLVPCLNPPSISFELGGWPFPFASPSYMTRADAMHGPAGGPFSLGKVEDVSGTTSAGTAHQGHTSNSTASETNSGLCVGIIVSSDMGERTDEKWRQSGMRDTWVLGEPFFRGMGIVFDDGSGGSGEARMGFRMY